MSKQKIETKCLECQARITLEPDVQAGEVAICPECSTDLEILQIEPLKLGLAPEVQEDWGQ